MEFTLTTMRLMCKAMALINLLPEGDACWDALLQSHGSLGSNAGQRLGDTQAMAGHQRILEVFGITLPGKLVETA